MRRYLHIGIHWNGRPLTDAIHKLVTAPSAAEDWFMYGGNCWIVYTTHTQTEWGEYIRPHISESTLLIYEVVNLPYSNGSATPGLWEWFNRVRN
jgi:hypothetical protein